MFGTRFPLNADETAVEFHGRGLIGRDRKSIGIVQYDLGAAYSTNAPVRLVGTVRFDDPALDLADGSYRLQLADGVSHLSVIVIYRDLDTETKQMTFGVGAAPVQAGKHNVLLHRPANSGSAPERRRG